MKVKGKKISLKYMLFTKNKEHIIVSASGEKKTILYYEKIHLIEESQWERNESQISSYVKTAGRLLVSWIL